MNDDENKPQTWTDPALEARVVAGVLGETSAFEAAEVERLVLENPELALFKRRIEAVHGLVGEAVHRGNPKIHLSPERRNKILQTIGGQTSPAAEKVRVMERRSRFRVPPGLLIRIAACLVIGVIAFVFVSLSVTGIIQRRAVGSAIGEYQTEYGKAPTANADIAAAESESVFVAPAAQASSGPMMVQGSAAPASSENSDVTASLPSPAPMPPSMPQPELGLPPQVTAGTGIAMAGNGSMAMEPTRMGFVTSPQVAQAPTASPQSTDYEAASSDRKSQAQEALRSGEPSNLEVASGYVVSSAGQLTSDHQFRTVIIDRDATDSLAISAPQDSAPQELSFAMRQDSATGDISRKGGDAVVTRELAKSSAAPSAATPERPRMQVQAWSMPAADEAKKMEEPVAQLFSVEKEKQNQGDVQDKLDSALALKARETSAPSGASPSYNDRVQVEGYAKNKAPITPAYPTEFTPGTTPPVLSNQIANGKVVDGFINYGSPITAGATSGSTAISANAVDALLFSNQDNADAPSSRTELAKDTPTQFGRGEAGGGKALRDVNSYTGVTVINGGTLQLGTEAFAEQAAKSRKQNEDLDLGEKAVGKDKPQLAGDVPLVGRLFRAPAEKSREAAPEIRAEKQPFSTFSLHVSDVSFQLAKDAMARGARPDPDRIRAEEFYNAFDYNDPAPASGEQVACRVEQCAHPFLQQRDLVRIALKVAASGRASSQPLRLTILLDTSGSMEREDRAASVQRALGTLATLLGPNDRVTLIGFARTPRLLAEAVPGDQAGKLVEIAARTPAEGGTNLEQALSLASELALKQRLPAAQNRIVLLTDGAANLGDADPARLAKQIEKTRQQGISFDACGVGANGLNDEILEALTRKGDGRYYLLNKPEDADAGFARQLAGAFRPAAENVKVQVRFNPARVAQYRLIGFEKHLLKKEDFRNDKVAAAELSAEEAGVALYQVETLPEGDGDLGEVSVRFRDPATGAMVERSWPLPYEAKVPAFDQASPSMQLAAASALLAEQLRGNAGGDLNALAPVINGLRGHFPHQTKVNEFIQMFEKSRP